MRPCFRKSFCWPPNFESSYPCCEIRKEYSGTSTISRQFQPLVVPQKLYRSLIDFVRKYNTFKSILLSPSISEKKEPWKQKYLYNIDVDHYLRSSSLHYGLPSPTVHLVFELGWKIVWQNSLLLKISFHALETQFKGRLNVIDHNTVWHISQKFRCVKLIVGMISFQNL